MSSVPDLGAATRDERNHGLYRRQCELEIVSTFSFQDGTWLSDIAPELLTEDQRTRLKAAKVAAVEREEVEKAIPDHLLYVKGWPTVMPTPAEAELLAHVRRHVAKVMQSEVRYTDAESILQRYGELMEQNKKKKKPRATTAKGGRSEAAKRAWETRRAER
jgi:hypothetical protein